MRCDTPVYFQKTIQGAYDANTGDYAADTVQEVMRYASVTDTGADTLTLVYGGIKQGSKTVRIFGAYADPFDHIRIDDTTYRVDMVRKLRNFHTFVVSEVQ